VVNVVVCGAMIVLCIFVAAVAVLIEIQFVWIMICVRRGTQEPLETDD
jgi:hypothetical protein